MCMKPSRSNIVFAIIEMEDDIASAALLADHIESYLWSMGDGYSADRILYELNRVDDRLHEARSKNARIRKEINDAKRKASEQS